MKYQVCWQAHVIIQLYVRHQQLHLLLHQLQRHLVRLKRWHELHQYLIYLVNIQQSIGNRRR